MRSVPPVVPTATPAHGDLVGALERAAGVLDALDLADVELDLLPLLAVREILVLGGLRGGLGVGPVDHRRRWRAERPQVLERRGLRRPGRRLDLGRRERRRRALGVAAEVRLAGGRRRVERQRQGHSSGVSGAPRDASMCPEVGTGEPAGTTRCRLCQRAHIGSTSAQIRPLPSASAVVRATKRRRTRAHPAAGPAQARTSSACTAARAPRAPRAPGRRPPSASRPRTGRQTRRS